MLAIFSLSQESRQERIDEQRRGDCGQWRRFQKPTHHVTRNPAGVGTVTGLGAAEFFGQMETEILFPSSESTHNC